MHIRGALFVVAYDHASHLGEGVEVVKDIGGVIWSSPIPPPRVSALGDAAVKPPGIPFIVGLHLVCPFRHCSTLLILSSRAAVVGAAHSQNLISAWQCMHSILLPLTYNFLRGKEVLSTRQCRPVLREKRWIRGGLPKPGAPCPVL